MVPGTHCSVNEENENLINYLTWDIRHLPPFKRNKSNYFLPEGLLIIDTVSFLSVEVLSV